MDWLERNEPQCFKMLNPRRDELLDFKVLKHYSHGSGRFYSADRWAVTGDFTLRAPTLLPSVIL